MRWQHCAAAALLAALFCGCGNQASNSLTSDLPVASSPVASSPAASPQNPQAAPDDPAAANSTSANSAPDKPSAGDAPQASAEQVDEGEIYTVAAYNPAGDPAADLASTVKLAQGKGKRIILEVGGKW